MSKGFRRSLFILAATALMFFAFGAAAQQLCEECDPYSNYCSDPCLKCTFFTMDGCGGYTETTCGAVGSGGTHGRCIADNCEPSWTETSRVTQGTYDGNSWNSCTHHSVQWVTLTDGNSCNLNSDYWVQHYCDNVIDGTRSGGWYPSCCDQLNDDDQYDPLFTCDGNHYCTG